MTAEVDIVERLRAKVVELKHELRGQDLADWNEVALMDEAADTIERLRAGRDGALREAAEVCAVQRRAEKIERHARKLLNFDGGPGSQMYHASKVYDARKALQAALLSPPRRP